MLNKVGTSRLVTSAGILLIVFLSRSDQGSLLVKDVWTLVNGRVEDTSARLQSQR